AQIADRRRWTLHRAEREDESDEGQGDPYRDEDLEHHDAVRVEPQVVGEVEPNEVDDSDDESPFRCGSNRGAHGVEKLLVVVSRATLAPLIEVGRSVRLCRTPYARL